MIPLDLLKDIKDIVDELVEKTYYIHSKFVLTELGGFPVPLRDAEDKYPAVLSQVDSIKYSPDLSQQTMSVSISYLRPCSNDLSDVPETQIKATDVLMTICYNLRENDKYQITSEIVLNSIMHKSVELLAGAVANLLITTVNKYTPCC